MSHNSKTFQYSLSMHTTACHILIFHSFSTLSIPQESTLFFQSFSIHQSPMMVPEMEKPRVTEIWVRMDCNGCVQKIKKALHGITGIYDIYVDFPQQKLTIIGSADPEKIVKAIKKTRKSAIICSHTEQSDQPAEPTAEQAPEGGTPDGGAPPPESNPPPSEPPQTEAAPPPPEAQKESPPPPPPPDNNPPSDAKPSPEASNGSSSNSTQPSKPKDLEEIHVVYHHPPDYGYRYAYGNYPQHENGGQWNAYHGGPPQPVYVTHSYNTYKPSPYVTEYAYPQSQNSQPGYSHYSRPEHYNQIYQSQTGYTHYSRPEQYSQVYQSQPGYSYYSRPDHYSPVYNSGSNSNVNGNGNGNITSMFSEENPNACSIV